MNAIEFYEKLFYAFAGMSALSLGLSIFLFIRFDIPQTFALLTGRARRKTIQEIENRNAQTGKLRQSPKGYTEEQTPHTAKRRRSGGQTGNTGKSGRTAQDATHREARRPKPAPQPMPQPAPQPMPQPAPQQVLPERLETEVLSTPAMQTEILAKPTGITEDLGQTEMLRPAAQDIHFYFQVTENTVSIHTDELI